MKPFLHRLVPQRLGSRLGLAVSVVVWAAILLFGIYTVRMQGTLTRQNLESQATALARHLAVATENPLAGGRHDELWRLVVRSAEFPQVMEVGVTDPRGRYLALAVHTDDREPRPEALAARARESVPAWARPALAWDEVGQRVVAWHPVLAGELLGWVKVTHSTEELRTLRLRTELSMLAACLLAGLGSLAVLKLVLHQPLRAIDQARDFAAGLLVHEGLHLAPVDGPVETRALAANLNRASTQLLLMRQAVDTTLADLRHQEAALADSNQQLRTIFALSPDALVGIDAQGLVRLTNPALHRLIGLEPSGLVDRPVEELEQALKDRVAEPEVFEGLEACFVDPSAAGSPQARRRLTLARPRFTVLELVGVKSVASSMRWLVYLRDITHESEVDRMKSEFLSTAAHELRTPMTSIHACVELMLGRDFEAPRRRQMLGVMQRQSQVLMAVVDDLLDLARIEARRDADFVFELHDLADLVRQAVADFATPVGRPAPEWEPAGEPGWVRVDRLKLAQVLRNLLSNAYKYSPRGGPVRLRLLAPRPGPEGLRTGIEVQDQGIGMTPEQLARVGERFYRADTSGHILGTGLGISIVSEILALMGGSLALRSEPGQGTTATVWLPAVTAPASLSPAPAAAASAAVA